MCTFHQAGGASALLLALSGASASIINIPPFSKFVEISNISDQQKENEPTRDTAFKSEQAADFHFCPPSALDSTGNDSRLLRA